MRSDKVASIGCKVLASLALTIQAQRAQAVTVEHAHADASVGAQSAFDDKTTSGGQAVAFATVGKDDSAFSFGIGGHKKVRAFASATKTSDGSNAAASEGLADVQRSLTFQYDKAPRGELLTVKVHFDISGSMSAEASCQLGDAFAQSLITLSVANDGASIFDQTAIIDNDPSTPDSGLQTGTISQDFLLINGAPGLVQMSAVACVIAAGINDCQANAQANLGATFKWMGVVEAHDSKGNPITGFTLTDEFGNDWTKPALAADINGDDKVNVDDLLAVINSWGACPGPAPCPADLTNNGVINVDDLLMVINGWEP